MANTPVGPTPPPTPPPPATPEQGSGTPSPVGSLESYFEAMWLTLAPDIDPTTAAQSREAARLVFHAGAAAAFAALEAGGFQRSLLVYSRALFDAERALEAWPGFLSRTFGLGSGD